jgi:hypothetical protein
MKGDQTLMDVKTSRIKNQGVGDVPVSSPNKSLDLGVFVAEDAKQSTSLSDALESLMDEAQTSTVKCSIGKILLEADEATTKKLIDLIDRSEVPSGKIAHVLSNHGYTLSLHSVQRHRRRLRNAGCGCPK